MKNDILKLEIKRKILIILVIIFAVLFLSVATLMLTATTKFEMVANDSIYVLIAFFLIVVTGALSLLIYKDLSKKYKIILMDEVAKSVIKNGKYFSKLGISESDFKKSDFIKKYDKYLAHDAIIGETIDDKKFYMCNIEVDEFHNKGTKEEYTSILYTGIFGIIESNEKYKFSLNIVPDVKNKYLNQITNNIKKMFGVENIVRLENTEFERYFEVYSSNQIEARKKVTIEFMEKILTIRKKLNYNMYMMYSNNRVYFFIPEADIIKAQYLAITGISQKIKDENIENIKLIVDAVNSL